MKKAACIAAIVMGITTAEILLLLALAIPRPTFSIRPETLFSIVGYLVLPGNALFVSLAVHGRQKLGRRILTAYITPAVIAAILIAYLWIIVGIIASYFGSMLENSWLLQMGLVILWVLLVAYVVYKIWKHTRNRGVELDFAERLRQRQLPEHSRQTSTSRRALAASLSIPFVMVLVVFLFLPETWAIASHVIHPGKVILGDYRVAVPWTSIALWNDSDSAYGVMTRGVMRARLRFPVPPLFNRMTLSSWQFTLEPKIEASRAAQERWFSEYNDIVESREVAFAGGTITCQRMKVKGAIESWPELAHLACRGTQDISVTFFGESRDVEAFYRLLSQVEVAR